jgi:phosphoglycerate dehydrogenase-like enzyme
LIDAEALASMRTDALLINVARGPIVDTDALVTALRDGDIRGATLDVTDPEPLPADHPLWSFESVQITPHNAGNTPKYYDRLADILATNLRRIEETGGIDGLENQVV